jgi:hypothetical protein
MSAHMVRRSAGATFHRKGVGFHHGLEVEFVDSPIKVAAVMIAPMRRAVFHEPRRSQQLMSCSRAYACVKRVIS